MKYTDESIYWDSHDLLTYNAMFNFAIGGRGTGKTFNAKQRCINQYIKHGRRFIYLRRYESELDDKEKFFLDVKQKFPEYEFNVYGPNMLMRKDGEKKWETIGYFMCLSKTVGKKSVPFDDVFTIVYDEFIIDKGNIRYLSDEVSVFLDFYNTVDRWNDRVKVLFLANAVSIVNPYFLYYKIRPRKGKRFTLAKDGYCCVEFLSSKKFVEKVSKTRFGRMIQDTQYYEYAVENRFKDDSSLFIAKKSEEARFHYALRFDGHTFGIWVDYFEGVYYVSSKCPKDASVYVLTRDDMAPNLLMLEKTMPLMKSLKRLYMAGMVFFDSAQNRELFNDVLEYLSIK